MTFKQAKQKQSKEAHSANGNYNDQGTLDGHLAGSEVLNTNRDAHVTMDVDNPDLDAAAVSDSADDMDEQT